MAPIRRVRSPRTARAVATVAVALLATGLGRSASAVDGPTPENQKDKQKGFRTIFGPKKLPLGTLGYGPPGPVPGYPGFGLRYAMGYGYGGSGLGTQANGGYPYYGGVGYPHASPELRRAGGIVPFNYFGGPGGPTPSCPNFFAPTGPLAPDQPVLDIPNPSGGDYGCYTGTIPYPEPTFTPYASPGFDGRDAGTRRGDSANPIGNDQPSVPPPPPPPPPGSERTDNGFAPNLIEPTNAVLPVSAIQRTDRSAPTACQALGIGVEPAEPTDSVRGLRVTQLAAGRVAERVGLQRGDRIQAANGYATERVTDLEWIIQHATRDGNLALTIRSSRSGVERVVAIRLD